MIMKDYIHFVCICLLFIGIFFMFGTNCNHRERIDELSNSINKLIRIEIVSQMQFTLLLDKVDSIDRRTNPNIAQK